MPHKAFVGRNLYPFGYIHMSGLPASPPRRRRDPSKHEPSPPKAGRRPPQGTAFCRRPPDRLIVSAERRPSAARLSQTLRRLSFCLFEHLLATPPYAPPNLIVAVPLRLVPSTALEQRGWEKSSADLGQPHTLTTVHSPSGGNRIRTSTTTKAAATISRRRTPPPSPNMKVYYIGVGVAHPLPPSPPGRPTHGRG
jgi:hypothetical protein